jgi:large subunit ribosomal protein L4
MPRKMRRAAICSALSAKAGQGDIVLIDQISMDAPKTRDIATMVKVLTNSESALLLLADRNEIVEKSARNLPDVKALRAGYLNIRDLLGYDKILMPLAALDVVSSILEQDADDWADMDDAAEEEE